MSRAQVAVLCDYAEEQWPSMDLVAAMLIDRLSDGSHENFAATRIQPVMHRRFQPWMPADMGRNADRLMNRHWDYLRYVRNLTGFDVYHVVDHSYAQLVHRLPAGRTVVTCHDTDTFRCLFEPEMEPRSRWFRAMVNRTLGGLRKAGAIACVSDTTRKRLIEQVGIPANCVHVVPNGVDPVFQSRPDVYWDRMADQLLGPRTSQIELLHVGSTIPRKRIDLLMAIFATLRDRGCNVRLLRVGAPLTEAQRTQMHSLKIENHVVALPFLEQPLLAAVYRRAALTLLPSEAEGFGLPLAESMACGTPVLASDIPALREVGSDAGCFCAVGAVDQWAIEAQALLRERAANSEIWTGRVSKCLERARHYSWDRNAEQMTTIYQTLLERN